MMENDRFPYKVVYFAVIFIAVIVTGILYVKYEQNRPPTEQELFRAELEAEKRQLAAELKKAESRKKMYAKQRINIRKGRGTDTPVVGNMDRGREIGVDSLENGWYVAWNGNLRLGYAYADLLQDDPIPLIEIADWNWRSDPSFGYNGALIISAEVRNNTERYISLVRLEYTVYNTGGRLISTGFFHVQAIPPGSSRSGKTYGDYYGTEDKMKLNITDARYADR